MAETPCAPDGAPAHRLLTLAGSTPSRLRIWFSSGSTLPDDVWAQRHRWILILLWLHVPGVFVFALVRGNPVGHSAVEASFVGAFALVATLLPHRQRRLATVMTAMGLMTASAVLVHLADGSIEMHFHYFVMVGVVALYQDWLPFVVAIAFVFLQHGIAGAIDPSSVYDHPAAVRQPWVWAAIHGGFILAMSLVGVASWRLNEMLQQRAQEREEKLAEAQSVAHLGSWELDVRTEQMEWSAELFRLLALDPDTCERTVGLLLAQTHADDRNAFEVDLVATRQVGTQFSRDLRILMPDSGVRWLHARVRVSEWDGDQVAVISGTAQDVTDHKRTETELSETLSLLTATLDSTADGILVVDLEGKITSFNQRFVDLWRIPSDVLDSRDDDRALGFVLSQLRDPDAFIAKVRELYARPDAQSEDVIEFLDSRIFERSSLPQRVEGNTVGRVWSFRDITERKRLESELSHQAFHDSLTGLANQALFRDRVDHALARATRGDEHVAVLFVDLDDFKTVNDSLGHTAGDALLVAVADRLRGCLRASDSAARLGGDEFAVLLEDVGPDREAEDVADRLIASLQQPFTISRQEVFASASIGIAFGSPATNCDHLLRNADLAMYTAKRLGKNRSQTYLAEMHSAAVDRLEIETALRRGLDRGELTLAFQPMIELASGRIMGVEALVRWRHPERGILQPSEFVTLAEEAGLIGELGRQVLATACGQIRRWQIDHPAHAELTLSVNVSTRQLQDDEFVDYVSAELARSGLPPSSLVLEITESAMMQDTEASIRRLDALKATGVKLAIDDFGTGYSSLSYLQRFPVDILKIDRAFVAAIGTATEEVPLVPAIVSLARALHLQAVAEGVETAVQVDALVALGCDYAQGFFFSEPVEAGAMGEQLAEGEPRADSCSKSDVIWDPVTSPR